VVPGGTRSTTDEHPSASCEKQYRAKLHRLRSGESAARIYEYVDREVLAPSRTVEKRPRATRLSDDRLTEYDEEALRQFETEVDEP
jgi:hypothetical protein